MSIKDKLAALLPRGWMRLGVRLLAVCAVLSLAYALAIPYLPEYFPKYAALHVLLAASACVLLMLALLAVILTGRRRTYEVYQPLLRVWRWIAGFSGALFLLGGMITTALEVFFILSAVWLARRLFYLRKI